MVVAAGQKLWVAKLIIRSYRLCDGDGSVVADTADTADRLSRQRLQAPVTKQRGQWQVSTTTTW